MTDELARHVYRIPYDRLITPEAPLDLSRATTADDNASPVDADDDGEDEVTEKPSTVEVAPPVKKPKKPKTAPIPIPDGILGETVLLLLECEEIKELADKGLTPTSRVLKTADDFLRVKVGPIKYADAVAHAPTR
jgi:hypothetical protein